MPGPGKKTSRKGAKVHSTPRNEEKTNSQSQYIRPLEIDEEEGWNGVMAILCQAYQLPDMTKRSGLKKIHNDFDRIHQILDEVYQRSVELPPITSEKVRGGIVCIFTSMCVDSVLRNKLMDKGILDKLIPLLDIDSTRHVALRALVRMSHHGGVKFRYPIARQAANIVARLIESFPDDDRLAGFGVAILSHCVTYAVDTRNDRSEKPNEPEILKGLDMGLILRAVVNACRRDSPQSWPMLGHGLELLVTATLQTRDVFYQNPMLIDFLIAGMSSKDWTFRCMCLTGLIRLQGLAREDDTRAFDPRAVVANLRRPGGVPPHLDDAMMKYGPQKCELYMGLDSSKRFQELMLHLPETRDLYKTGLEIARLIPLNEFAVADGMFQYFDEAKGTWSSGSFGLPFDTWVEGLPYFARAIRAEGRKEEIEAADILDLKYAILRRNVAETARLATKGLETNPQCAYFYYGLTMTHDHVKGLKAAKQGMKCKGVTPFLRFQMMQRAVEHAGYMGLATFEEEGPNGERKYEQGLAFFMSALDDAKRYLDEAPPDNRRVECVAHWFIILSVLAKDTLSHDLREVKSAIDRLALAYQFSEFMGWKPPKTDLRLTQELIVERYQRAMKTFGPVFARINNMRRLPDLEHTHDQLEEDLNAWLNDVEAGNSEAHVHEMDKYASMMNFEHIALYTCTYCGNPSAVLKKCAACAKAKYCDTSCQKAHWPDHKKACKPKVVVGGA